MVTADTVPEMQRRLEERLQELKQVEDSLAEFDFTWEQRIVSVDPAELERLENDGHVKLRRDYR
jgi:hypothetical protein